MRIIIMGFFGFPNGMAATNRVMAYAQGLRRCGADVQVVCTKPSEPATGKAWNEKVSGIFHDIPFTYGSGTTRIARSRLGAAWLYLKSLWWLIGTIRKIAREQKRFAILAFPGDNASLPLFLLLSSRLFGGKLLIERSEFPFVHTKQTPISRLMRWLNLRWIYPRLDGLIVISTYLEEYYRRILGCRSNIVRIPIMVELDRWKQVIRNPEPRDFTIAYCGNLDELGEVDDLISAFAFVHRSQAKVKLLIIGDGKRKTELQQMNVSQKTMGFIEFTGYITREEVESRLSSCDLLVLPERAGTSSSAAFPTKLGEYLATGKPVIVTATGDIPLYLKDGESAYLVQPGDVKALADRIQEVVTHYETALQIGKAGQRVAAQYFDIEPNCRRAISFINELWAGTKNL
jgi:glycosyltransferase involved in cell wall biosynthesis